jgi:hypothetical protein
VSLRPEFDPTYLVAQLLTDPFWFPLEQVADMTDFQIARVAFHPRDEKGALKQPGLVAPERAETPEDERAVLFAFGAAMGIPHEELVRTWEARHGPTA